MSKGRKSTPSVTKELRGTARNDRMNPNEPRPQAVKLNAPDWLDANGRKLFEGLSELLHGQKVLTQLDEVALTLLCDTYSTYREAREFIVENGQYAVGIDGNGNQTYKAYPQMAIMNNAYSAILRMLTEFGLTPSSRSKVSSINDNADDPFEAYLKNN